MTLWKRSLKTISLQIKIMQVHIISGSNRKNSESFRVSNEIYKTYKKNYDLKIELLDLYKQKIPLWDEEGLGGFEDSWCNISSSLEKSDAFVFVLPEWHGMAPPQVKNLILHCGSDILFHKPALIVTVSSSLGGAYPAAELRISSQKNSHICWIPEQVIIRNVKNWDIQNDSETNKRLILSMKMLLIYSENFINIRESLKSEQNFKFGM